MLGEPAVLGEPFLDLPLDAGRQAELSTVGTANTTSSISSGWMLASSAMVTTTRTIQPIVSSSDMYMWSSTNTWLRSTASRSR